MFDRAMSSSMPNDVQASSLSASGSMPESVMQFVEAKLEGRELSFPMSNLVEKLDILLENSLAKPTQSERLPSNQEHGDDFKSQDVLPTQSGRSKKFARDMPTQSESLLSDLEPGGDFKSQDRLPTQSGVAQKFAGDMPIQSGRLPSDQKHGGDFNSQDRLPTQSGGSKNFAGDMPTQSERLPSDQVHDGDFNSQDRLPTQSASSSNLPTQSGAQIFNIASSSEDEADKLEQQDSSAALFDGIAKVKKHGNDKSFNTHAISGRKQVWANRSFRKGDYYAPSSDEDKEPEVDSGFDDHDDSPHTFQETLVEGFMNAMVESDVLLIAFWSKKILQLYGFEPDTLVLERFQIALCTALWDFRDGISFFDAENIIERVIADVMT